jgi:L-ascorbate metabolism protein UlaG (beta-lactamase superfamily)
LTSKNGIKVLTDPYDTQTGLVMPEVTADIVTISHDHGDHNYIQAVKEGFIRLDKPGSYKNKGIGITGISTFHDDEGGRKRGLNTVFIFDIDGLRICHCGDLGHVPAKELVDKIGKVDVLMLPVGSVYTLDANGAAEVVRLIKPAIAIPMHFKIPKLTFKLDGVEKFLDVMGGGTKNESQEIDVTRETLEGLPRIMVLM